VFVGQNRKSMRDRGDLVPLLTPAGRASMRQMIRELESLPPVRLDANIDSVRGTVPFQPTITISATGGAVSSTTIDPYRMAVLDGRGATSSAHVGEYRLPSPASGGSVSYFAIGQNGPYLFEVTRIGQSRGSAVLKKTFSVLALQTSSPPHPRPSPPVKPNISVTANGDGSFTVSGSLLLKNAAVHIRVVDDVHANDQNLTTTSDASGQFSPYKTTQLCVNPGQIHFSANDGRSDLTDLTGTFWSNTVQLICS